MCCKHSNDVVQQVESPINPIRSRLFYRPGGVFRDSPKISGTIDDSSMKLRTLINLVPRAIRSFSCRTQPPVMTLVPTYTFVGNLFQAFVMYAQIGLRGSRRFGLVLTGTSLSLKITRWF